MTRAPISLPGQTVILDYGEVISLTPSAADREVIAGLAGVGRDSEPFWRAYLAHRDGLDQGSAGVAAYWQAIAGDVGASWDDARVHELWAADFRSWLSINPGTALAFMRDIGAALPPGRRAGVKLARTRPLMFVPGDVSSPDPLVQGLAGWPGKSRNSV